MNFLELLAGNGGDKIMAGRFAPTSENNQNAVTALTFVKRIVTRNSNHERMVAEMRFCKPPAGKWTKVMDEKKEKNWVSETNGSGSPEEQKIPGNSIR